MMLYVETEDGESVNGDRASEMRQHARHIWDKQVDQSTSWKLVGMPVKVDFYKKIAEWFPELRLCQSDWKADQIAKEFYLGWYKTKYTDGSQRKRSRKDSEKALPKRMRSDAFVSLFSEVLSCKSPTLANAA
jgi:hypothetical protein